MKHLLPVMLLVGKVGLLFAQANHGVVTGQIRSMDGIPIPGIRVAALEAMEAPANDASPGRPMLLASLTETDGSGRYRLEGIPPGRYYIFAGNLEFPTYFPGTRNSAEATVVSIATDATLGGIDFRARPSALRVSGHIIHDRRVPFARSETVVLSGRLATVQSVIGPDGLFSFPAVPPGSYMVSVSQLVASRNNRGDIVKGMRQIGRISQPVVLDEKDIGDLELTVGVAAEVTGRVQLDTPIPWPPGLQVAFTDQITSSTRVIRGEYFATTLPEGKYHIAVSGVPNSYFVKSAMYGTTDLLKQPLIIDGTDTPEVEITLAASEVATVKGRIVVEDGGPLPTVFLSLDSATLVVDAVIAPDGTFTLLLPKDEYRTVPRIPLNYQMQSFTSGSDNLLTGPLKIAGTDSKEMTMTLSVPLFRVSGRIVSTDEPESREPLEVTMSSLDRSISLETPGHKNGIFEFSKVPPATYTISVPAEYGVSSSVVLGVTKDADGIELVMPRQIAVSGRVVLSDGSAPPDLSFTRVLATGSHGTYSGRVQPDGTFTLWSSEGEQRISVTGVPAGYAVKSMAAGSTDVMKEPLRPAVGAQIQITLGAAPPVAPPMPIRID